MCGNVTFRGNVFRLNTGAIESAIWLDLLAVNKALLCLCGSVDIYWLYMWWSKIRLTNRSVSSCFCSRLSINVLRSLSRSRSGGVYIGGRTRQKRLWSGDGLRDVLRLRPNCLYPVGLRFLVVASQANPGIGCIGVAVRGRSSRSILGDEPVSILPVEVRLRPLSFSLP
jgi:hypothetical protein